MQAAQLRTIKQAGHVSEKQQQQQQHQKCQLQYGSDFLSGSSLSAIPSTVVMAQRARDIQLRFRMNPLVRSRSHYFLLSA